MRKLGVIVFALACVCLSVPPQAVASDEICDLRKMMGHLFEIQSP